MALYEHVFLARQDLAQAQVDALAEAATKIVTDNQGKVVKTETWGLRSLAYRIAKNRKAHYVMLEIDAPGSVVAELERQTQINEDVIRYTIADAFADCFKAAAPLPAEEPAAEAS